MERDGALSLSARRACWQLAAPRALALAAMPTHIVQTTTRPVSTVERTWQAGCGADGMPAGLTSAPASAALQQRTTSHSCAPSGGHSHPQPARRQAAPHP